MLKAAATIALAAVGICALAIASTFGDSVEASAPTPAVQQPAIKGDRLDRRVPACSQRAWPNYETQCLHDKRQPEGRAQPVRVVVVSAGKPNLVQ